MTPVEEPKMPDPFASLGGGTYHNGGWLPPGMAIPGAPPTPPKPPEAGTAPAGSTGVTPAGPAQTALTAPTPQGPQNTVTGAFQQALMSQMSQGPITAQDPTLKPAIQANQLAEQRGAERSRGLLAEMAAREGFSDSGAFDSQALGIEQNRAQREGAFEGGLVADRAKQQQQRTLQLLALTGGMLSDQDRMALQQQLAQLQNQTQRYGIDTDASLRREGLGAQTSLGGRELDIRDKLGSGQLNLGLLSALLNDQQFGQNLGAQLGMFGANLNQSALLSLIGGL
jgi:hypothetical protein